MLSASSNHLGFSFGVQEEWPMMLRRDGSGKASPSPNAFRGRLPLQTEASLMASLVGTAAVYGFSAGDFTPRRVSSLQTTVVAALWGTKRRSRCREIVLTLFVKGHFVDPLQNAACQRLRQLRRMAEQRPEAFAELERVWRCCANGGERGVMDQWLQHTAYCKGWVGTGKHPRSSRRQSALTWDCWMLHEIRQGLRLAECRKAGNIRNEILWHQRRQELLT